MRYLLGLAIIWVGLFASCEDTKKASEETTSIASKKEKDSVISKTENDSVLLKTDSVAISQKSSKNPQTEITNENAVSFFTDYGNNNPETSATIQTQHGEIEIALFKDTPLHRANFIYLVKQGYFNGTYFHRVVKNFIIQGGNSDNVATVRKRNKIGKTYLLPAEIIPGRNHTYGTLSGAKEYRENPDNRTMPYEFFIFLGPQTSSAHLNESYTIFGKVVRGMEVVEKIANLPADEGDWPLQNVYIKGIILR
ncbi:peptidylprolyl isomerase [Ulvibacter sp. MAR_2010_11]|uniref:peptidylprolyl isomerase n=1 Tax=Ulvibacter sp. MAR_2010_11 TaxID=1250229 RepID=UPI000C2C67F7|nr:peptidylprolyl isomerase [Ulvibacter sp. MAR_2010_11]PKA83851.1 peptidylprolyl isomerase [Ulvibacter sp. MAR_2010_11]